LGEVHASNAAPSSEHSNLEFGSLAEKVNLADVLTVVASGPEPIVVSGGTVSGSSVQVWLAGVGSALPASSTARTSKVCGSLPRLA
jgi:hypothetical protein